MIDAFAATSAGFSLSLSLILAIGSQNAFVLRQGLRREHVFLICLTCFISDTMLIVAGIAGFDVVIARLPWLAQAMRYVGAVFLFAYGARSLWSALKSSAALSAGAASPQSLKKTLLICLALTWLNPHVYLDTVFLIGSISTQYEGQKAAFAVGAGLSSLLFFFSLGYGARLLQPLFAKPFSWRVLDVAIAVIMWSIALSLVWQL